MQFESYDANDMMCGKPSQIEGSVRRGLAEEIMVCLMQFIPKLPFLMRVYPLLESFKNRLETASSPISLSQIFITLAIRIC